MRSTSLCTLFAKSGEDIGEEVDEGLTELDCEGGSSPGGGGGGKLISPIQCSMCLFRRRAEQCSKWYAEGISDALELSDLRILTSFVN